MEDEQRNEVDIVYENVLLMIEYRDFKPAARISNPVSVIDSQGFIEITSTRKAAGVRDERDIIVYILDESSDYASKSADFKKLQSRAVAYADRTGRVCDIVFIAATEFTKHIIKHIDAHNSQSQNIIEYYQYDNFMMNVPMSELQPVAITIRTREEVEDLFARIMLVEFHSMPILCRDDPIAIWYGIKPGQVVEYKTMSDSACNEITYRYVKS